MYSLNKCGHWRQNRKLSKIHCYQTSLYFSQDWKEMKVVSKDILDPNRRKRRRMILWIMYFHLWHVNHSSSDTPIYWNYLALITKNLIINISRTSLKWVSNVKGKLMVIVAIMVMAPVRQNWGFAKVPVTFANCVSRKFLPWLYLTEGKSANHHCPFQHSSWPPVLVYDLVLVASFVFDLGPNLIFVWGDFDVPL